jgi:hypothetical protein
LTVQPIAKSGNCPSGYSTSGAYCKPGATARAALEKRGSCPSGYSTSGAYCLAGTQARPAVPKIGAGCPSGWSSSGDYCLRNGWAEDAGFAKLSRADTSEWKPTNAK